MHDALPIHRLPARSHARRVGRSLLVAAIVTATIAVLLGSAARAVSPADQAAAQGAANWIKTMQQADGSFEVLQSGFETQDAVLAIAEAAQTGASWSTTQAHDAVANVKTNGLSALDWLDDVAEQGLTTPIAAKLIVLVASPLGISLTSFDPAGDGNPVDLVAKVVAGAQPDGSYGFFGETLYAALARKIALGSVPAITLTYVRNAQQANGGWSFTGDPSGSDVDPDTTAVGIETLIAGGANPATDADVRGALTLLANELGADGSWKSPFDDGNPSSTGLGAIAVAAAGYDPSSSCWRDTFAPSLAGAPYVSPAAYLRAKQAATSDGHVLGPFDDFFLNTFGTSQAVQGLLLSWFPVVRAPVQTCEVAPTTTTAAPSTSGDETATSVAGVSVSLLPATGSPSTGPLLVVAVVLLLTGTAALGWARRTASGGRTR